MRIFSQSSSVFGTLVTSPSLVTTVLTASKMLSARGSSMSCISSLTETTGLRSPQTCDAGGEGGGALGDEQVAVKTLRPKSAPNVPNANRMRKTVTAAPLLHSSFSAASASARQCKSDFAHPL